MYLQHVFQTCDGEYHMHVPSTHCIVSRRFAASLAATCCIVSQLSLIMAASSRNPHPLCDCHLISCPHGISSRSDSLHRFAAVRCIVSQRSFMQSPPFSFSFQARKGSCLVSQRIAASCRSGSLHRSGSRCIVQPAQNGIAIGILSAID